jgi:hypothetical protein
MSSLYVSSVPTQAEPGVACGVLPSRAMLSITTGAASRKRTGDPAELTEERPFPGTMHVLIARIAAATSRQRMDSNGFAIVTRCHGRYRHMFTRRSNTARWLPLILALLASNVLWLPLPATAASKSVAEEALAELRASDQEWRLSDAEFRRLRQARSMSEDALAEYAEFVAVLHRRMLEHCHKYRTAGGDPDKLGFDCKLPPDGNAFAGSQPAQNPRQVLTEEEKSRSLSILLAQSAQAFDKKLSEQQDKLRAEAASQAPAASVANRSAKAERGQHRSGSGGGADGTAGNAGGADRAAGRPDGASPASAASVGGGNTQPASRQTGARGGGPSTNPDGGPPARPGERAATSDETRPPDGLADPGAGPGMRRSAALPSRTTGAGGGSDDDVVAGQLREAAEREPDLVLKEKLWEEYRKYKSSQH